jgi:hypothetical protein
MLVRSTSVGRQAAWGKPRVPCQWRFFLLEERTSDFNTKHTNFSLNTLLCFHFPRAPLISLRAGFFLFPRLKERLKGWRHENVEAIEAAAMMALTGIPKETFTSCFQDLQKRWRQCNDCGGNYFEGDRKH